MDKEKFKEAACAFATGMVKISLDRTKTWEEQSQAIDILVGEFYDEVKAGQVKKFG